jgi:hypothetical protein
MIHTLEPERMLKHTQRQRRWERLAWSFSPVVFVMQHNWWRVCDVVEQKQWMSVQRKVCYGRVRIKKSAQCYTTQVQYECSLRSPRSEWCCGYRYQVLVLEYSLQSADQDAPRVCYCSTRVLYDRAVHSKWRHTYGDVMIDIISFAFANRYSTTVLVPYKTTRSIHFWWTHMRHIAPKIKKSNVLLVCLNLFWTLCVCHVSVYVFAMYRAHRPFASAPLTHILGCKSWK